MAQLESGARELEWLAYYKEFPSFSAEAVRDYCYPRILEHDQSTEKAIVLVHGLRDSPYLMTALGEYFFKNLGYNVYLPLLHCHGLKEPKGMEEVKLDQWKANVKFAVDMAKEKAQQVSIGGLSTGGTLSFYTAVRYPDDITGTLYLFSAALDLTGGVKGEVKEIALRFPGLVTLAEPVVKGGDLIGPDPYRYAHVDLDGAQTLSQLMEETDYLISHFSQTNPFRKRVFAAHSESDKTADISGIKDLKKILVPELFTFFPISKEVGVSHAGLVLKEPLTVKDATGKKILEEANPKFDEMMKKIEEMEKSVRGSGGVV